MTLAEPIAGIRRQAPLLVGLISLAAIVVAIAFLSITVGARPVTLDKVWAALTAYDPNSTDHRIIWEL